MALCHHDTQMQITFQISVRFSCNQYQCVCLCVACPSAKTHTWVSNIEWDMPHRGPSWSQPKWNFDLENLNNCLSKMCQNFNILLVISLQCHIFSHYRLIEWNWKIPNFTHMSAKLTWMFHNSSNICPIAMKLCLWHLQWVRKQFQEHAANPLDGW